MQTFDLVVIGGGPGGYPAAIKAAQLGKKVALVEENTLGGTCLNRGCIPTKALLANTAVLSKIHQAEAFGITVGKIGIDYAKMVGRKDSVVQGVRKNLEQLIKANQITVFRGRGKFREPGILKVLGEEPAILQASHFVIATGSEPKNIAAFPFDGKKVHSSTTILDLTKLPRHLVIIGAGYIGCEFATLFRELGVEITLLEMMPRILPMEELNLALHLAQVFAKQGIKTLTEVAVDRIDTQGKGVKVQLKSGDSIEADLALVSIGRKLNSDDLGLESLGVAIDGRGAIEVNDRMETSHPGVFAVGDVTGKCLLAHAATHQGIVAAINACGGQAQMHYGAIPAVVFTHPELASVGMTLAQAQQASIPATLGAFPFQALGKAAAAMEQDGFAQIVVQPHTGQILGAQVVGHEASSLIAEMALAITNELTIECLSETIHAHPTLPEVWHEASLIAQDMSLHLPPKAKKRSASSVGTTVLT